MKETLNRGKLTSAGLTSLKSGRALWGMSPPPGKLSPAGYGPQGTKLPAEFRTEFSSPLTETRAPLLSANTDQVTLFLLLLPQPSAQHFAQHMQQTLALIVKLNYAKRCTGTAQVFPTIIFSKILYQKHPRAAQGLLETYGN